MAAAPLRGLVLTGGKSRRMGADKAFLQVAGQSLLDRAVEMLSACLDEVYVSVSAAQAEDERWQRYARIVDLEADLGPAAGLVAAHLKYPHSAWLVVACDMPLLDAMVIKALIAGRDCTRAATAWMAADGSGPEPLCAIYEPATLAAFADTVAAGRNPGPRAWLAVQDTCLLQNAPDERLAGANTPEEFAELISGPDPGRSVGHQDD